MSPMLILSVYAILSTVLCAKLMHTVSTLTPSRNPSERKTDV